MPSPKGSARLMTNSSRKLALMPQAVGGTDADDATAGDSYRQRHRALDASGANLNASPSRYQASAPLVSHHEDRHASRSDPRDTRADARPRSPILERPG